MFEMRQNCRYTEPDNSVAQLDVDTLIDGKWQALDLNTLSAGFQIFIYALFTCQHMYFRVNAAERGLVLSSSRGSIVTGTDMDWQLERLQVDFSASLKSGTPTQEDIDFIIERMGLCPVSCNLKEVEDSKVTVAFEPARP